MSEKKFVLCKFGNMDTKIITAETALEHGYLPTHKFDDGMEIFKPKWLKAMINPASKRVIMPLNSPMLVGGDEMVGNEDSMAYHYVEEPW